MEVMDEIQVEKYSTYKDSGIEWVGEIPSHWEIKPGHTVVSERTEKNIGLIEKVVLSLSYGKVVIKPEEKLTGLVPESFETYQLVYPGDIIIRPTDLQNDKTSLRTGLAKDKGIITSAYINLKAKDGINNLYLHYFLHALDITKAIYSLGSGLRQSLGYNEFKRLQFPIPPLEEQTRIAQFLDRKTAQIDQAIAQKEKLIELLKERRQILIHNAVTRGLNPNVKMKPSGVEWIGEIPEHWEIRRLKYLAKIKYGLGQPPKEKEGGLPIIRATNVERGKIVTTGLIFIDPEDVPWDRDPELNENDIIVVRSGAYTGDSAIVTKQYAGAIAGYDMVMTPNKINPRFLASAMLSNYILYSQLYLLRMRAAQPHLNAEELGATIVIVPPNDEQKAIVEVIETFSSKLITAISFKENEIEKLKEYKSTLINSAVTGKIKV